MCSTSLNKTYLVNKAFVIEPVPLLLILFIRVLNNTEGFGRWQVTVGLVTRINVMYALEYCILDAIVYLVSVSILRTNSKQSLVPNIRIVLLLRFQQTTAFKSIYTQFIIRYAFLSFDRHYNGIKAHIQHSVI